MKEEIKNCRIFVEGMGWISDVEGTSFKTSKNHEDAIAFTEKKKNILMHDLKTAGFHGYAECQI